MERTLGVVLIVCSAIGYWWGLKRFGSSRKLFRD
jgi:hypothetical protein